MKEVLSTHFVPKPFPINNESMARLITIWEGAASKEEVIHTLGISVGRLDDLVRRLRETGVELRKFNRPAQFASLDISALKKTLTDVREGAVAA